MIRQKLIKYHQRKEKGEDHGRGLGREGWRKPRAVDMVDCPTIGLYTTYSKYDLLMIKSILEADDPPAYVQAIEEFDINWFWVRFGEQTIMSLFDMRTLEALRHQIIDFGIVYEDMGADFSSDEMRLAGILMNYTQI